MGKRKKKRTAKNSDRHILYELSVQEPEAECDLIDQVWSELRRRKCRSIREDFCGTAVNSIEWVKRNRKHSAVGVDVCGDVLEVARSRIAERCKNGQAKRIELIQGDVMRVKTKPVDCAIASNFSYFIFKDRKTLKRYFRAAYRSIKDDGLFLADVYGGSDSFLEMTEPRDVDGFTYVWDQDHYDPISGHVINHIHFRFPDGSKMKKAFSYDWRLWTIPELRELLEEAGFAQSYVYWEGTDDDGEGNGEWSRTETGEADQGWIAYLVAEK